MTALLCVVVILTLWGYLRLRRLSFQFGTFDCAWRTVKDGSDPTDRWVQGLGEYRSDRLVWWKAYSLSPRPRRVWLRSEFELVGRTPLNLVDLPGMYLVACKYAGVPFEMMMSAEAYHGLSSWSESAPPHLRGFVL
ncbi:DUF2550 domain-containing protein [Jonesiaceae bacterium BS-20]|uniref:DUF2550 domain-containing protein n=1 Tax=Jonesiaceae bacterium BS-20 TaxID=3120821 RepID=A0AAU7DW69_9MICO